MLIPSWLTHNKQLGLNELYTIRQVKYSQCVVLEGAHCLLMFVDVFATVHVTVAIISSKM